MKVSVLGAGAIGSMLGGLIKQHSPGLDMVFIGRGVHGDAMRRSGTVRLEGPWHVYDVPIRVTSDLRELTDSDFVLFTVKSQATLEAIQSARPYLGGAVVISIQNGINQRQLADHVSSQRLVVGMTATNMAVLEPGSVSLQLNGATIVGALPNSGAESAAEEAAKLLRRSGLRVDPHPNVLGVQYNKLAINAMGYASALSASNFISEAILHQPWRRLVGLPILEECIENFERSGIVLDRIPGVPDVHRFRRVLKMLDTPGVGGFVSWAAKSLFNRKPIVFSLYQDLLRKKTTEIEYINGEIVRLARQSGAAAPANALAVEMVHELEQRGDGTFFTREQVLERFRAVGGA